MAHLIKLEDYISRYQFDLHRYPSQFSRMKKERWYYVKSEWEQARHPSLQVEDEPEEEEAESKGEGIFSQALQRLKGWRRSAVEEDPWEEAPPSNDELPPKSLEQVKQEFLDELYKSQLRWASSSLLEESTLHPRYKADKWLRFFCQHIPDNYFLLYKPVLFMKKAPIELDIMLISPTEIICLTMLEGSELSVFEASSDRFWIEYVDKTRKKRVSPLISLGRMSRVLTTILEEAGLSYPIRKVVLSPSSMIDHKLQGAKLDLIDRRGFDAWHQRLRKHPSPLKHQQMKVTAAILSYCHTVSSETVQEDDEQFIDEQLK
ncbi:nuclease-related domain-containing protein [Halalkalibacter oceani]|uniref:nuclease-related domain-containing protein n=1 Tax=Halalkalibacter oceani TaxID=1653776 RepID=UPI00339B165B